MTYLPVYIVQIWDGAWGTWRDVWTAANLESIRSWIVINGDKLDYRIVQGIML